jgi:hypothetical protein
LLGIFRDLLEDPEPLDADGRRLLSSFQRLKTPTEIPVIPDSSAVGWALDKIGSGYFSVVKLSLNSKKDLIALKTPRKAKSAALLQREVAIHKTLKHPLILELRGYVSGISDHISAIMTEFAGNGSLASHLQPTKCHLSGANRITRIVVGIALATRFIHSRDVTHRDLPPATFCWIGIGLCGSQTLGTAFLLTNLTFFRLLNRITLWSGPRLMLIISPRNVTRTDTFIGWQSVFPTKLK